VIAWTRKTAPTTEPVSKDEAKLHIRHVLAAGDTTEDALLDRQIVAARDWVQEYTGRSLYTQTWQCSLPAFPERLWLPMAAPLQSVTFVKYYDSDNVLQTLSASLYTLPAFHEPAQLARASNESWPSTYLREDAVQIEYVTGATSAADIPRPLVQAVLLLVGHWYEQREAVLMGTISKEVEMAVTALCAPYRLALREPEFCGVWWR
jgi:uncharacterized phiE125 gp8 family phage protein